MKKIFIYPFRIIVFCIVSLLLLNSCGNSVEKTSSAFISIKCKSVELAPTGKYRYTFTIKNFTSKLSAFTGNVTISIISKEGRSIRYDDFDLIDFKNGSSKDVFIEASTGLTEVHNEAGIAKYGYVIKNNYEPEGLEGFHDIEEYKLNENYELKSEYK